MKLADLYRIAVQKAERRGKAAVELPGGARVTVRIEAIDSKHTEITVAFSRLGKRVGDVELTTFRRHCEIPEHAERLPPHAPDQTIAPDRTMTPEKPRYFVGYRWRT